MTLSETSTEGIHVDFVPHTYGDQNALNSQFKIRKLDSHSNYLQGLRNPISLFFASLFINGFSHMLEGRKDTQSGSIDIVVNQEVKPSTEAFLDDYFEVYKPRDYLDYRDATNLILEGHRSIISDQNQKNKANLKGRDELYTFLSKKVEAMLDIIFLPLPGAGYKQFDQFLENPEIWKSRTLKQAKNFLRAYIDRPSRKFDFIGTLREILRTGDDGYITLQSLGAASRTYDGNALFDQGIRIPITYNELVEFLSFDNLGDLSTETLFTLLFQYSPRAELKEFNYMSPKGYSLDINQFWGMNKEEISAKTVNAYITIINTFSKENLGKELYKKEFTIKLFTDRGAGINPNDAFQNRFASFGISEHIITFIPGDSNSLRNAIASMITYLYSFPDTFAVIKQVYKNFLFADIHNIHTTEYIKESDYPEKLGGSFMWSENGDNNGLTKENYDNLVAAYSGIFNDRDIRYLLGFSNKDIVGLILSKFQTLFREQIDDNIEITDLRS